MYKRLGYKYVSSLLVKINTAGSCLLYIVLLKNRRKAIKVNTVRLISAQPWAHNIKFK
jgi:hypothetical protein